MSSSGGTLCLTFDNMGNARDVGLGVCAGPGPQEEDIRIGYPNMLDLLERLDLKATFFIEGWNALHHPDTIRDVARRGHEIGVHGWVHEVFHELAPLQAERVLTDALAAFRAIGVPVEGFRAPGGRRGANTLDLVRKFGLGYDSSVDERAEDTMPRLMGGVPNIPWQWEMIDYFQYHMNPGGPRSPLEVAQMWRERLYAAARTNTVVTIILHACISGIDPERLSAVEQLLQNAKAIPNFEIITAGTLAKRVERNA